MKLPVQPSNEATDREPEFWDLIDVHGQPTGRTVRRVTDGRDPCALFGPGDWHRVALICVFNSIGEVLIQQRCAKKSHWANMWDFSAGGAVLAGETSQQGAERELAEEISIVHDFSQERPAMTISFALGLMDIYLIDHDCDLTDLRFQMEEVQALRWASLSQVLAMIDQGVFCTYHHSIAEAIFALHANPGHMTALPT